eukprot:GFUD01002067.1.p1 GENE.GFUD01002067.1~~GFUD01002067.1.p1  ORF type:complete len:886 (-),score=184.00 GFUD01002067.1:1005-3662(-)
MSKTTMRKGKQDDKFSLAIREIQAQNPANKRCFDCEQRGPTYVNMTIGSYVCAKCSGMLRGINPPHRIKSISMSSFTSEEVEMVRSKGNAWCTAVWLGTYQKSAMPIDFKDDEKIKEFIIAKYEKKRYHLEPSQANFSLVNQPPALGSTTSLHSTTGSVDSHSSHHKLSSSSLIGSTLKARVDPGSQVNISVSRPVSTAAAPALVSRPVVVQDESGSQGKGTPVAAVATTATSNGHSTATHQQFSASKPFSSSSAEPFANFADFDTAAFDILRCGARAGAGLALWASKPPIPNPPPRPIFCPNVLPLPRQPLKSQSSCDVFSLTKMTNKSAVVPVLPPPPVKAPQYNNNTNPTQSNTTRTATPSSTPTRTAIKTRPSPPKELSLISPHSFAITTSSLSPNRPQPRTNPYFSLPKSPKSEFGPFKCNTNSASSTTSTVSSKPPIPQNAQVPPPLPKNSPHRPFHSTLNLSVHQPAPSYIQNQTPQDTYLDQPPSASHTSLFIHRDKTKSKSPPIFVHNTLPRQISKSMSQSHHNLPNLSSLTTHSTSNPFLASSSPLKSPPPPPLNPQNPFLPPTTLPKPKIPLNPFRAPISSLPPDDPSDTSRELGTQLFTELLTNTLNCCSSPVSCVTPCVTNPNVSDPLGNPPTTTLPPMNRKSSTGLVSVPAPAKEQTISASDRYSALKELDDLFKTSTISPGPDPTAVPDIFSSSTQEPNIFSSSTEPNLFSTSNPATIPVFGVPDTQHNGSPGWAGQGWGGRSSSPALTQWTNTSSQAASTPPMWTPQWGNTDTNNSNVGWPDSNQKQLGPPVSSHSTNPFGTSPSNPPPSQFYSSDNNNDLFAAAPKPFISEKPGLMESGGNPWTGTGNGVAAFTANMTPAPNPNNPFL